MQLIAIDTCTTGSSCRVAESAVVLTRDGFFETARADIDGALVGGVPVTGGRGLIG